MGEGRRASPFPGYEGDPPGPLPQRTHFIIMNKEQTQPLRTSGIQRLSFFTGIATTTDVGIFKNNTCLDYVLSQDSGFLSTTLKEEGTRSSSLAEVSLGQILGTCGFSSPVSGIASALSRERNVKRLNTACGRDKARGR